MGHRGSKEALVDSSFREETGTDPKEIVLCFRAVGGAVVLAG